MHTIVAVSQHTDYRAGLGFVGAILLRALYAATPAGRRGAERKRQAAANRAAHKQWQETQRRARR